jgi:YHS domain-containing protein
MNGPMEHTASAPLVASRRSARLRLVVTAALASLLVGVSLVSVGVWLASHGTSATQLTSEHPVMKPSDAGQVSREPLSLGTQLAGRAASAPAPAPAQEAEDPVCHMQVRVEPGALRARHEGKDFYFCSQFCKAAFEKEPARYQPKAK